MSWAQQVFCCLWVEMTAQQICEGPFEGTSGQGVEPAVEAEEVGKLVGETKQVALEWALQATMH